MGVDLHRKPHKSNTDGFGGSATLKVYDAAWLRRLPIPSLKIFTTLGMFIIKGGGVNIRETCLPLTTLGCLFLRGVGGLTLGRHCYDMLALRPHLWQAELRDLDSKQVRTVSLTL